MNNLTTNAPPGTVFHFNGIHTLLLATENGALTLAAGSSFHGTDRMFVYARGASSVLTLASDVSTNNDLRLYGEGGIDLTGAINTLNFGAFSGAGLTSSSMINAAAIYMQASAGAFIFNGGSVTAEIFSLHAPEINVGVTTPVALNVVTLIWDAVGNLTWSGGTLPNVVTNSDAGVSLTAGDTLHILHDTEIDRSSGDTNNGMNVTLFGHSGLTVDGSLTTNLTPGLVDTGANTSIISDGAITVAGVLSLNTEVKTDMTSGGNIFVSAGANINGDLSAQSIAAKIKFDHGVSLGGDADLTFAAGGDMTTHGATDITIDDSGGGRINGLANLSVSAGNISTNGGVFAATINNNAGNIGGDAQIFLTARGDFRAGDVTWQIMNSDDGSAGTPGTIGGTAAIFSEVLGDFNANSFFAFINSRHQGSIAQFASIRLAFDGAVATTSDFGQGISTSSQGSGGGIINRDVSVSLAAGSITVGGFFQSFLATNGGGKFLGNATNQISSVGDLHATGGMLVDIEDTGFGNPNNNYVGGQIGGTASVSVQANNITTDSTASGVPGTDTMALEFSIYSNVRGTIGGDALVDVMATHDISAPGTIFFTVANGNYQQLGPGHIGGNASVDVTATNLFSGDLFAEIYNYGGASIGGSVEVALNLSGQLHASGDVYLTLQNAGGHITNGASLGLAAGSLSANSLTVTLDNNNNGQIGSAAGITTTIAGPVAINTDATFGILGSQTPPSDIQFNGGAYTVGGTFRSTIDGDGTIDFNNASIRADVIKAGVFGANGTLYVRGDLSAGTLLHLYAPGSHGLIDFVTNVTLNGGSAGTVLAANTIQIEPGVTVTLGGTQTTSIFTNIQHFNISGWGNFSGHFTTDSLSNAPPFDQAQPAQTIVYSGASNRNWSDATVWNPNVIPNNSNTQTYNASIASGSLGQDIAAGVVIEQLFMSGGTLRLDHPLTLEAGLQFSGGAINSGVLNIAGASTQSVQMGASGLTINNHGTYDLTQDGGAVFNGGGNVFNNFGTLRKLGGNMADDFNVPLNNTGSVSVQTGTLRLIGGGTSSSAFSAGSGAILSLTNGYTITNGASFSGAGLIQLENNNGTTFSGTITDNGNFRVNATGNFTDLVINGNTTLTGSGTLTLVDAARVRGSGVLTNAIIIQGDTNNNGSLGTNEIGIANQAGGVIDAFNAGRTLNVDPDSAHGLTNAGIMQASSGGILSLNGNGGGAFDNTGGTILADNGSEVQLINGASISGGTLNTHGTGDIRSFSSSLSSLTNAGNFIITNNTGATFAGTINNTSSVTVAATGNFTDLFISGAVTFTGGGVINLQNAARLRGSGTLSLVQQTVQGETSNSGSLGTNEIGINVGTGGLIDANVSGLILNVDPGAADGLTNAGLMRASNGGILLLNGNGGGGFQNNATISALTGSEVQLANGATITGGTLTTAGTGLFRTLNTGTLVSLTNAGNFIVSNTTSLTLAGTLTNTGNLTINSTGNFTDLFINGAVTLTGSGFLNLQNAARIRGTGTLFNGGPNGEISTIQGETSNSGSLGTNELAIVNRSGGLIDANVSVNGNGLALVVDPSASGNLTNSGVMRASNGGILYLSGNGSGAFNNSGGVIEALTGSQVQLGNWCHGYRRHVANFWERPDSERE